MSLGYVLTTVGYKQTNKAVPGEHESGGHNGGVDHDGHLQQGSHAQPSQESEAKQHAHTGGSKIEKMIMSKYKKKRNRKWDYIVEIAKPVYIL